MLYKLIILLGIFVLSLGQVSFSGGIFSAGIFPDMLLVLSIFWVVYFGIERKIGWIIMAGLFLDLATGGIVGKNIFILTSIAYIASYASLKLLIPGESGRFFLIIVFLVVGTLVKELMEGLFYLFLSNESFRLTLFGSEEIFLKLFFNLAFFMLIYFPVVKLEKTFFIQKEEIKI